MTNAANRLPPLDERELYVIAGLVYAPTFRRWFRDMNIGPAVLSSDRGRTIAAWACTTQLSFTPEVETALGHREGETMTIGEWLVGFCGPDGGTPPESIDRQARIRCAWLWKRWLPSILRHACLNPNDRSVFSSARVAVDFIDETLREAPSPFTEAV